MEFCRHKSIVFFILCSTLTPSSSKINACTPTISSAVTYELEAGSRLGDHLMAYSKAKWISYKYNIPFFYKPFEFSQHLAMHTKEKWFTREMGNKFTRIKHFTRRQKVPEPFKPDNATLYVIHRIFIDLGAWSHSYGNMADVFRSNKPFFSELKAMISPIDKIEPLKIPSNTLTVAVHVRRGGGFDLLYQKNPSPERRQNQIKNKFADQKWPTKFPPHSFYIEQIKLIAQYCKGAPLYVHIFTDDPNPKSIVNLYQKMLANFPLTFGCREEKNAHNNNVLADLFTMKDFNFLIRPESGLSLFAQILGNHKLVIYPLHATWQNETTLIVDKIGYSGPLISEFANQQKITVTNTKRGNYDIFSSNNIL